MTHQSTLTWSDLLDLESQELFLVKMGSFCRDVGAAAVTMRCQRRKVETGCFSESQASSLTPRRTHISYSASLVISEMDSV